jgi:phosphosulfolactate synthase
MHLFHGVDGIERPTKPRSFGITMVADWGIGVSAQMDLLQTGGDYFDFAKIAVGISRILSNQLLREKIALYSAHDVAAFPGGQYLEHAGINKKEDRYFDAALEAGYRWIEVSDNLVTLGLNWKVEMIRRAATSYGLNVLGEVGKKEGLPRNKRLIEDVRACLNAGARIVLIEAAEMVHPPADLKEELEELVEGIDLQKLMFELPGPWIQGVTQSTIHEVSRDLIARYGLNVNLGNVDTRQLVSLEAYRQGLGINAGSDMRVRYA